MKSKNPKSPKSAKIKSANTAPGCTISVSGIPSKSDGDNGDYKSEMSIIGNLILANYAGHSFSIRDFVSLSRNLDIPYAAVQKNFATFVKEQLADKRIVQIPTIMSDEHYVVV